MIEWAFYRSQHDNHSWLAALACIMDVCALVLVGIEALPPLQARMTFTMARQIIVQMAEAFSIHPEPFTGGERLDAAEYHRLVAALNLADLHWPEEPSTQESLTALRATYEPLMAGLAAFLLVPLPEWLPHDDVDDHWSSGHRGIKAVRRRRRVVRRLERAPTDHRVAVDAAHRVLLCRAMSTSERERLFRI